MAGIVTFVAVAAVIIGCVRLLARRWNKSSATAELPHITTVMRSFYQSVHGESFDNDDGTSRQAILSRCVAGDPVELVPEPSNPFDPNAVAVIVPGKGMIGYLPRDDDRRHELTRPKIVSIASITGGVEGKPTRGAVLHIDLLD